MIFNSNLRNSKSVNLDDKQAITLYEISALERMQLLDMWNASDKAEDNGDKYVRDLESQVFMVYCSIKPGLTDPDDDKGKDELRSLPERLLDELYREALILSGFEALIPEDRANPDEQEASAGK